MRLLLLVLSYSIVCIWTTEDMAAAEKTRILWFPLSVTGRLISASFILCAPCVSYCLQVMLTTSSAFLAAWGRPAIKL